MSDDSLGPIGPDVRVEQASSSITPEMRVGGAAAILAYLGVALMLLGSPSPQPVGFMICMWGATLSCVAAFLMKQPIRWALLGILVVSPIVFFAGMTPIWEIVNMIVVYAAASFLTAVVGALVVRSVIVRGHPKQPLVANLVLAAIVVAAAAGFLSGALSYDGTGPIPGA